MSSDNCTPIIFWSQWTLLECNTKEVVLEHRYLHKLLLSRYREFKVVRDKIKYWFKYKTEYKKRKKKKVNVNQNG